MKAGVLYSGGKDSSLMAVILDRLGYEVELLTMNFGLYPSWKSASESASSIGFKHRVLIADSSLIYKATNIILEDGFPNQGINYLHRQALELVSKEFNIVADGTRRDDKVPRLDDDEIKSYEDRNKVQYLSLAGFGHKTIKQLSHQLFSIITEPTNMDNNADYEIEIRYLISQWEGEDVAREIFPFHHQSRVIGWIENE